MANILIAEDDESMCNFLKIALEKAGHTPTITHDGLQAYKALEENPAGYDLLLSDIVMPGMDGFELSKKATALSPGLKVMFITGFSAVAVGHNDIDPKETKILSKPFHLNDLVEQVERILNTPQKKTI
ncbi:MAG: response regulator [Alphaproteobacteria bacterium]|nr:response regulator [Alphaproteobacteria bacterium]